MKTKTSRLALASFVIFIVSLIAVIFAFIFQANSFGYLSGVVWLFTFYASFILAIISLFLIQKNKLKGKWYAITTIILVVAFWLLNRILISALNPIVQ